MKHNYIITLWIIGLLLFGNLVLAVTYSLWKINKNDSSVAINNAGCVNIIYSDSNTFDLINPKSLINDDGVISSPRTITITNNCSSTQTVELHLDVLNTSTIDDNKIKVYVNGEYNLSPTILTNLRFIEGSNDIKKTYRLFKEKLEPGITKRINLRMWLDENATITTDKNTFNTNYYIASSELVIKPSLAEVLLNNNQAEINQKVIDNYNGISTTDDGLYYIGNAYYFRGNILNNYVSFANKLWRIISINQDNTIKLIYQGNDLQSNYYDDSSKEENVSYTNNSNINNDSNIKTFLDNWYSSNLNLYDNYIMAENYCNDTTSSNNGRIIYGSYTRNFNLYTPSISCNITDKNYGGIYNQKIGLITMDEVAIAGGSSRINNSSYYLADGFDYYTMSPAFYGTQAWVGIVTRSGKIDATSVNNSKEVRPVINLINSVSVTGDGSINSPYVIDDAN